MPCPITIGGRDIGPGAGDHVIQVGVEIQLGEIGRLGPVVAAQV
jgi:hypothetical protein